MYGSCYREGKWLAIIEAVVLILIESEVLRQKVWSTGV